MKYQVEKITRQIKLEKMVKKTLKTIILTVLLILLIANLIMLYQSRKSDGKISYLGKVAFFNIISESMEPEISVNDLVVIKQNDEKDIQEGDIITFERENGTIVTHRITNIENEDGQNIYTTKGDNNKVEDEEKIKYVQIYGKYLFKINKVGKIVEKLQENNGLITIIIIIIIFIILKNGNDKKRETRKKTREKYEIKKIRDEYQKKL